MHNFNNLLTSGWSLHHKEWFAIKWRHDRIHLKKKHCKIYFCKVCYQLNTLFSMVTLWKIPWEYVLEKTSFHKVFSWKCMMCFHLNEQILKPHGQCPHIPYVYVHKEMPGKDNLSSLSSIKGLQHRRAGW